MKSGFCRFGTIEGSIIQPHEGAGQVCSQVIPIAVGKEWALPDTVTPPYEFVRVKGYRGTFVDEEKSLHKSRDRPRLVLGPSSSITWRLDSFRLSRTPFL